MQFSKTTSYFKRPNSISLNLKNKQNILQLKKLQRRTSLNKVKQIQSQNNLLPLSNKKLQFLKNKEIQNPLIPTIYDARQKMHRKSKSSFSSNSNQNQSNNSSNTFTSRSKQLQKNKNNTSSNGQNDKRYKNYEEQVSENIYFNQASRANYFKNLIDTYFQHSVTVNNQENKEKKRANQKLLKRRSNFNMRQSSPQKELSTPPLVMIDEAPKLKKNQSLNANKNSVQTSNNGILFLIQSQQIQLFNDIPNSDQVLTNSISFIQSSYLPKITQTADDIDQDNSMSLSISQPFFNETSLKRTNSSLQKKIISFQNQVLRIYLFEENGKKYRIKEFKNILFLQREQKAVLNGIQSIWKISKFNPNSLFAPLMFPIKDQLFRLQPHPLFSDLIFIKTFDFYQKFIKDRCHEAVHFLINFVKDLKKVSGKVINNKINSSNIFYFKGKFILGQWQYSAFRDEDIIQKNRFQSRVQPILKCQSEWLVSPEYLAPQIIESMINIQKPFDLWKQQSAPDVWSLGLAFLQMITLVPMWMPKKSVVRGKKMKPRVGLLSTPNRSLQRILQKQQNLAQKIQRILNSQLRQNQKNEQFFSILLRMIDPNPSKRITYDEILHQLRNKN